MIIGTGIDIIELQRIEEIIRRKPRFIEKVLTETERLQYFQLKRTRQVEFVAGRFAAKEAFVKACGTGISAAFGWHDIEVKKELSGKPYIVAAHYKENVHLSISHSAAYAIASVIIESSSS